MAAAASGEGPEALVRRFRRRVFRRTGPDRRPGDADRGLPVARVPRQRGEGV